MTKTLYEARTTHDRVRGVLCEALGVDEEEVVPEATLQADLGAESIDFLDIVFRCEREFKITMRPKRRISDVFPTAWEGLDDERFCVGANPYSANSHGRLTDDGLAKLQKDYPLLDLNGFDRSNTTEELYEKETVDYLVRYIDAKLNKR